MDEYILIKIKSNTDEIFVDSFSSHYREMSYKCISKLGVNNDYYNDCTQDAFRVLYEKMKDGEEIENPRAWLYRTSDNFVKRNAAYIKRQREKSVSLSDYLEEEGSGISIEETVENKIAEENIDYDRVLRNIFSALSPEDYLLYELHYVKKMNTKETAQILGITKTNVTTKAHRLKTKIIQLVKENLELEYRR